MLSALFGNAREVDADKISREIDPILIADEQIVKSYKVVRDVIVFTNFRLIVIDKQGLTGKKQMLSSIPYKSISSVALETAGHFDVSAELHLWVKSRGLVTLDFKGSPNVQEIFSMLSHYLMTA